LALRGLSEGWGTYAVKRAAEGIGAEMRGLREASNLTMRTSGLLVTGMAGARRV
jgi:hypothetical protein